MCSQTSLLLFQRLLNDAVLGSSGVFRNCGPLNETRCENMLMESNVPTLTFPARVAESWGLFCHVPGPR